MSFFSNTKLFSKIFKSAIFIASLMLNITTFAANYAPNQLIVKFEKELTRKDIVSIISAEDLYIKKILNREKNVFLLASKTGIDPKKMSYRFADKQGVAYAEMDAMICVSSVPNDPYYQNGQLWGLNNTGQDGGNDDMDIDAPEAWSQITATSSVVVAVVDTGVNYDHEDLKANMWINTNEIPGNGIDDDNNGYIDDIYGANMVKDNGDPKDDHGHGNHCAGTIGAVGNNGIGITGVAWNTKIMGVKYLDKDGRGYSSDAVISIRYAREMGADIISCSWGGGSYNQALKDEIALCRDQGIIVVAAAGNNGLNIDLGRFYPSGYNLENIVTVGAINREGRQAGFSNHGIGTVNVFAPGEDILSLGLGNTGYANMSGTSMAAPHVSGMLALMKSYYPLDTYTQLINRLYNSVDRQPGIFSQTKGIVNLANSLAQPDTSSYGDKISNVITLGNCNGNIADFTSTDATKDDGEPDHAGFSGGKSIWYSWTTPKTGWALITTENSDYDTLLGVYTGSRYYPKMVEVASNDDAFEGSGYSGVVFWAEEKQTYYIAIDGKDGASGAGQIAVGMAPENDDFQNAQAIEGEVVSVSSDNLAATKEDGEPEHYQGGMTSASVWYTWTPQNSHHYCTIDTADSSFDTILAVYTGTDLNNLQLVKASDDVASRIKTSFVQFESQAGQKYYIVVDGWAGSQGRLKLNIDNTAIVPNKLPEVAFTVENGVTDTIPGTIVFDASESFDPDGEIVKYVWSIYDQDSPWVASRRQGVRAEYVLKKSGVFKAVLTIKDDDGDSIDKEFFVAANDGRVALHNWTFEEIADNGRTYDTAGTSRYMFVKGDAQLGEGVVGQGMYFNGTSSYLKGLIDLERLEQGSLSMWVKPEQWNDYSVIYQTGNFFIKEMKGELAVSFASAAGVNAAGSYHLIVKTALPELNQWSHIAVTLEDSKMAVYVNGELAGVSRLPLEIKEVEEHRYSLGEGYKYLGGGSSATSYANYFQGSIDEFKVHSLVLTEEEIAAAYSNIDPVTPPVNLTPIAHFTYAANSLEAPALINFDASTSSDSDGTIASYAWNFGDGNVAAGQMANHTFETAGTYQISLTVTDDKGATSAFSKSITVVAPPVNKAPTASFSYSASSFEAPALISFDASTSSDSDGSIASYVWSFGDGNQTTGKIASHTFATAGTYEVTLTVTDNEGAASVSKNVVTITEATVDPVDPPTGEYTFSGRLFIRKLNTGAAEATLKYEGPTSGEVVTDENGYYTFQCVDGMYTLTATVNGQTVTTNRRVSGADRKDANLFFDPYTMTGSVRYRGNGGNDMIPDVVISYSGPTTGSVVTDADGLFTIYCVNGLYDLELTVNGSTTKTRRRIDNADRDNVDFFFDKE